MCELTVYNKQMRHDLVANTLTKDTVYQETFMGEKFHELVENKIFCGEIFRGLLACAAKRHHTPKFHDENFRK